MRSMNRPPLSSLGDSSSIARSSPPSGDFPRNPCVQGKTDMKLGFWLSSSTPVQEKLLWLKRWHPSSRRATRRGLICLHGALSIPGGAVPSAVNEEYIG